MSTIIPKLGLHDLTDAKLPEYAQDKVAKIKASSAFGGLSPSAGEVEAKIKLYETALVAADEGTKSETQAKNVARKALESILTLQAQNCAEIADGDLALYLSTGYEAKDVEGTPVGILEAVTGFLLDYGDNAGELKADWKVLEHADNYTWQVYTDPANPDGSVIRQDVAKKSRAIFSGLPGGDIVWARVRGNGGSAGHGPWSDPAEKRVP